MWVSDNIILLFIKKKYIVIKKYNLNFVVFGKMFWCYICWKLVKWLFWELMMNGVIVL